MYKSVTWWKPFSLLYFPELTTKGQEIPLHVDRKLKSLSLLCNNEDALQILSTFNFWVATN